jgi:very-short-patch-repair endonuclease
MKFFDLDGKIISKDIKKYKFDRRKKYASKGQKLLGEALLELFPNIVVYTEVPCFGTKMRMDFFIPELNLCCEFDGEQHYEYNPFFHESKKHFLEQQKRDFLKEEWMQINSIRFVRINKDNFDELGKMIEET